MAEERKPISLFLFNRVVNPVMRIVLRSPFHRLADRALVLITFTGRTTGRIYRIPVQFARDGDRLWLYPGRAERKTWWRNLVDDVPVTVRLAGHERQATATAVTEDSGQLVHGVRTFVGRFPSAARSIGVPRNADESAFRTASEGLVMVRIDLPT